jgi:ferric-dicitrate binding protein FerR (iron transport regulator)
MDYSIINKYLAGEASEAEVKELFSWIESSPENREEFIQYKKIWVLTSRAETHQDISWNPELVNSAKSGQLRHLVTYTKYAAAVVIFLSLGMLLQYFAGQKTSTVYTYLADTQIEVPKGQMSSVILPDGTKVQLNSGSKLVYASGFNSGERTVNLEGEAFFNVAKDKKHSFIIKTKSLDFKVYGTSFNVQAYPEDSEINTTLVEGSLGVVGKTGNEMARLVPGENANFKEESKELVVTNVDLELYTSWKDGMVTFRNEKLKDIARKIERWYNVQIVINNPKLADELYMGTIMKNKPIDQLLEVFKLTSSLNYRIVPRADKSTLIYWE